MAMISLYKEVMGLNLMTDSEQKKAVAKYFFKKLSSMNLPGYFN